MCSMDLINQKHAKILAFTMKVKIANNLDGYEVNGQQLFHDFVHTHIYFVYV